MASYVYKAMSNGTLSNPYRFVRKGETVRLQEEFHSKWLVPADQAKEEDLPLTPNMRRRKPTPASSMQMTPVVDEHYKAQMDTIKANEEKADGKSDAKLGGGKPSAKKPEEKDAEPDGEAAKSGTGNQDVLG